MRDLDLSSLINETASNALVAEATAPKTLPTGRYLVRFRDVRAQENDDGYRFLHFAADAEADGRRIGTLYFDASPVERRAASGRLAREPRLFAQLAKALGVPQPSVGAVIEAFQRVGVVGAYVREVLISPERDRYLDASNLSPSERQDLVAAGYTAKNYVESIFPAAKVA
jgi:hypothetical protein